MDLLSVKTKHWVDWTQGRDYWKALVNVEVNLRVSKVNELVKHES